MEHSPSWTAATVSQSVKKLPMLRHKTVHGLARRLYPWPRTSVQIFPFQFLKIHFNIIFPFTPRSSKSLFSFRCACTSLVLRACHMPRPSHPLPSIPLIIFGEKCSFLHTICLLLCAMPPQHRTEYIRPLASGKW